MSATFSPYIGAGRWNAEQVELSGQTKAAEREEHALLTRLSKLEGAIDQASERAELEALPGQIAARDDVLDKLRAVRLLLAAARAADVAAASKNRVAAAGARRALLDGQAQEVAVAFRLKYAPLAQAILETIASSKRLLTHFANASKRTMWEKPPVAREYLTASNFLEELRLIRLGETGTAGHFWYPSYSLALLDGEAKRDDKESERRVPVDRTGLDGDLGGFDEFEKVIKKFRSTEALLFGRYEYLAREILKLLAEEWRVRREIDEFNATRATHALPELQSPSLRLGRMRNIAAAISLPKPGHRDAMIWSAHWDSNRLPAESGVEQ